jgi:hypothetical protein
MKANNDEVSAVVHNLVCKRSIWKLLYLCCQKETILMFWHGLLAFWCCLSIDLPSNSWGKNVSGCVWSHIYTASLILSLANWHSLSAVFTSLERWKSDSLSSGLQAGLRRTSNTSCASVLCVGSRMWMDITHYRTSEDRD